MIASPVSSPRKRIFALPTSIWYGVRAGLVPGLFWALYAWVVRLPGPVATDARLLSHLIIPDLVLLPVLIVLATGFRLGWRNGSVLDGLIAGLIAGTVFTLVFSTTLLIVRWSEIVAEAHADHVSVSLEALAALILVMFVISALSMTLGVGLGSLGAFIGLQCGRRRLAWRKYAALVATKFAAAQERISSARPVSIGVHSGPVPMISSSVATLSHRLYTLPKTYWYGISAGLICGILSVVMAQVQVDVSYQTYYQVISAMNPLMQLLLFFAIDLVPLLLMAATGMRLGWRNGRVRDGLIAGAIAGCFYILPGAVFIFVYLINYLLTAQVPEVTLTLTHTRYTGSLAVLVVTTILLLVIALIGTAVGAVLGTLGALAGRWWRRRGQRAWRTSTATIRSKIATSQLYRQAVGYAAQDQVQPDDALALVSSTFVISDMERQPIAGQSLSELSLLPE